ncbi:SIR2 family protein [Bacillus subtilis]
MEPKKQDKFKGELLMYPHLKHIRENLWAANGKSKVSVMVGSGFSLNARKVEDSLAGMAMWDDLKMTLIKDLKHHPEIEYKNVLKIAQIYKEEYGRSRLDEVLKEAIPDNNYEPDELHHKFLKLPWADVFTTNYDTLLERSSRNLYDRNYQIIYDVNDIPSSTQPRIIKLHGSFPANRPFIFTESDYLEYPERFSPFVNMVQQSIMETTFVLIGFSGDDPNFNKWTNWVKSNLGEHMPKIYMIGYGQKNRQAELESKGITLIDFKDLYKDCENPYYKMFNDLFDFLSFENREEKTKWPHRYYVSSIVKFNPNIIKENWSYNRETYPGWVVMPDEIRRRYANVIQAQAKNYISSISDFRQIEQFADNIKEILWCFDNFHIPLDLNTQKSLEEIVEKNIKNKSHKKLIINIILQLLKTARLNCNQTKYMMYEKIIKSNFTLSRKEMHSYSYDKILFYLNLNDFELVEKELETWSVNKNEIEWGIKKAATYARINEEEIAKIMLEGYIKTIRKLLSVEPDDFRLLSLESVALHIHNDITLDWNNNLERRRFLRSQNCDSSYEFDRTLLSIMKIDQAIGITRKKGFDPGTITVSHKIGIQMSKYLDSFAVSQIKDLYSFRINNLEKYEYALANLNDIYPLYSQIKRLHLSNKKEKIDNILSREAVYKLDEYNLQLLTSIINKTFENKERMQNINKYIEILSRVYFVLPERTKEEMDNKVIQLYEGLKNFNKIYFINLFDRILFSKNSEEKKVFCEKLLNTTLKKQFEEDKDFYISKFFDPFLIALKFHQNTPSLNVQPEQLKILFEGLKDLDQSIKESSLIRLTFLCITQSLPENYYEKFIKEIDQIPKIYKYGISDFIYSGTFDKIKSSNHVVSIEQQQEFLSKEIPKFYFGSTMSDGYGVISYIEELRSVFSISIIQDELNQIHSEILIKWLNKFFVWWESQKEGVLREEANGFKGLFSNDNLIEDILIIFKDVLNCIPPTLISNSGKTNVLKIYNEVKEKGIKLSNYLLPSLKKFNIEFEEHEVLLNDVIYNLVSNNYEINKMLCTIFTDYLLLIKKGELQEDYNLILNELISMMKYGSTETVVLGIKSINKVLLNCPEFFDEATCNNIVRVSSNYLNQNEAEEGQNDYFDFQVIASFAGLIGTINKKRKTTLSDKIGEWKLFVQNHRLPEIRQHSNSFNNIQST